MSPKFPITRSGGSVGVYLHFVVARMMPEMAHDNCFVFNAPQSGGIHSSRVRMLLEGVGKHAPDLAAPAWYRNAFSMAAPSSRQLTRDHFFEPSGVLADLQRMQGIVAAHPSDFPVMHWIRVGNQAGINSLQTFRSWLAVYYEGRPSTIHCGWDEVKLYHHDDSQPPIDLMHTTKSTWRLRSESPKEPEGLEVRIFIEREPFAMVMATEFEDARSVCRWAHANRCFIIPWLG
jgi:hypothetical protein